MDEKKLTCPRHLEREEGCIWCLTEEEFRARREEIAAIGIRALDSLSKPEPDPVKNEHPPVWPWVIDRYKERYANRADVGQGVVAEMVSEMTERHMLGIEKYGTPLQPHNGRKPLVDAAQEALDGAVYTAQAILEGAEGIDLIFYGFLDLAHKLYLKIRDPSTRFTSTTKPLPGSVYDQLYKGTK